MIAGTNKQPAHIYGMVQVFVTLFFSPLLARKGCKILAYGHQKGINGRLERPLLNEFEETTALIKSLGGCILRQEIQIPIKSRKELVCLIPNLFEL